MSEPVELTDPDDVADIIHSTAHRVAWTDASESARAIVAARYVSPEEAKAREAAAHRKALLKAADEQGDSDSPWKVAADALCEYSDDRTLPLQCRFKLDHEGEHDWQMEKGVLTDFRAQLLRDEQDSPSGMLPRRTPGVALGDSEGECGATDAGDAAGPLESESTTVIERWRA